MHNDDFCIMMMMMMTMMMTAMMMMVCDHEYEYDYDYDNDIQVSGVFIPRRLLMLYLLRISSCTYLSFVRSTLQEKSPSFICVTVS